MEKYETIAAERYTQKHTTAAIKTEHPNSIISKEEKRALVQFHFSSQILQQFYLFFDIQNTWLCEFLLYLHQPKSKAFTTSRVIRMRSCCRLGYLVVSQSVLFAILSAILFLQK